MPEAKNDLNAWLQAGATREDYDALPDLDWIDVALDEAPSDVVDQAKHIEGVLRVISEAGNPLIVGPLLNKIEDRTHIPAGDLRRKLESAPSKGEDEAPSKEVIEARLFSEGCAVRARGCERHEILALITALNERYTNGLSPEELARIADKCAQFKPDKHKGLVSDFRPTIITASDLQAKDLPRPTWIVQQVLAAGLAILSGRPKCGKSWLAMNLAHAVSTGTLALGKFPTEERTVISLMLEDHPVRAKSRLNMTCTGGASASHLITFQWPTLAQGGITPLKKLASETENLGLVIIDTLAKFRGPRAGKDAYSEDYETLGALQDIASTLGVCILAIHHERKARGDTTDDSSIDRVLGSTAIAGAADDALSLQKKANNKAVLHICGRSAPEQSLGLEFHEGVWTCVGDAFAVEKSEARQAIRRALLTTKKPMGPTEICRLTGLKDGTVKPTLLRMAEDGQVEHAAGQSGKYVLPPEDSQYAAMPRERRFDYNAAMWTGDQDPPDWTEP